MCGSETTFAFGNSTDNVRDGNELSLSVLVTVEEHGAAEFEAVRAIAEVVRQRDGGRTLREWLQHDPWIAQAALNAEIIRLGLLPQLLQ